MWKAEPLSSGLSDTTKKTRQYICELLSLKVEACLKKSSWKPSRIGSNRKSSELMSAVGFPRVIYFITMLFKMHGQTTSLYFACTKNFSGKSVRVNNYNSHKKDQIFNIIMKERKRYIIITPEGIEI